MVVNKLQYAKIKNNCDYVFQQGDREGSFFLIDQGQVLVEKDGKDVGNLLKKDGFGEIAMLSGKKRSASIKPVEKKQLRLWVLNSKTYRVICNKFHRQQFKENKLLLEKLPLFSKNYKQKKLNLNLISSKGYNF